MVAELGMVPNQPLIFHGDGQPRYEDDLIAYAWVQYLETGDPKWLPRNAMVKSAVRAMDVVSQFMQTHREGRHLVNRFVVGGGSKRGWTTWLTGAMDDRVIAIVPIVHRRAKCGRVDASPFFPPTVFGHRRSATTSITASWQGWGHLNSKRSTTLLTH